MLEYIAALACGRCKPFRVPDPIAKLNQHLLLSHFILPRLPLFQVYNGHVSNAVVTLLCPI